MQNENLSFTNNLYPKLNWVSSIKANYHPVLFSYVSMVGNWSVWNITRTVFGVHCIRIKSKYLKISPTEQTRWQHAFAAMLTIVNIIEREKNVRSIIMALTIVCTIKTGAICIQTIWERVHAYLELNCRLQFFHSNAFTFIFSTISSYTLDSKYSMIEFSHSSFLSR